MNILICLFVLTTTLFVFTTAVPRGTPLNVHIIAHTHDDTGWLKTVDQYFVGSNSSIQDASVQYILDSVITCLEENPDRKFIYVETAFFWRWWNEQTDSKKDQVRALVNSGQLEFINGGWCMNDEAAPYFEPMIDQMTLGHRFLKKEFGISPKIGWHIDPFGHSAEQASLFARMGFEGFIFTRIDYQDKQNRINNKELEFIWKPSPSLGSEAQIFSHVTHGHYSPPDDFNFERGDDPIQDDPNLYDVNVKSRCDEFANEMYDIATYFKTPELLILWGDDFQYSNANLNFKNIDKLIKYINEHYDDYGINIKYSTPSIYVEAVNSHNISWSTKYDDFFPYADGSNSYWTGYYTSRPAFKRYEREMNSLLHASEKIYTLAPSFAKNPSYLNDIEELGRAMALVQHHDAVSGTEKQHVTNDYSKRLSIGQTDTMNVCGQILGAQLNGGTNGTIPKLSFCPLLNESICPSTDALSTIGMSVPVLLYNPLILDNFEWLYIDIPTPYVEVSYAGDPTNFIISQVNVESDKYTLIFPVEINGFDYSTVIITSVDPSLYDSNLKSNSNTIVKGVPLTGVQGTISISNDLYEIFFDGSTGLQTSIKVNETLYKMAHNYLWYLSNPGDTTSGQKSGAYIFRPQGSDLHTFGSKVSLTLFEGPLLSEIKQTWTDSSTPLTRRTRLYQFVYAYYYYIEIINDIGPIYTSDHQGKEVVSYYTSDLETQKLFYTDANGQEMQTRQRNYRPTWELDCQEPVSCNYYPINSAAYIEDKNKGIRATWVVDRSCGGSSMVDGGFEIMHHRAMVYDDGRGVGEALNEKNRVILKNYMLITKSKDEPNPRRRLATKLQNPLLTFFGDSGNSTDILNTWSKYVTYSDILGNFYDANLNIHLKTWSDDVNPSSGDTVQLRLFHLFAVGEEDYYSDPITIDLNGIFMDYEFTNVVELTLSGNQEKEQLKRLKWKTDSPQGVPNIDEEEGEGFLKVNSKIHGRKGNSQSKTEEIIVTLNPMEIKTFSATLLNKY